MRYSLFSFLLVATASAADLSLTIYNRAQLPPSDMNRTVKALRGILEAAGISVHFKFGDAEDPNREIWVYDLRPPGTGSEAACNARPDIALAIAPSAPPSIQALGMAQPYVSFGLNVRVFYDRVQEAAARANLIDSVVLAHVMAHEIGHVLLRSSLHTTEGLMRSVWTSREYLLLAQRSLNFTTKENTTMELTLSRAGCRSSPRPRTVQSLSPPVAPSRQDMKVNQ